MIKKSNPCILIVTPEITYLPEGMGNMANRLNAKAGGLADVSASLVSALFELGANVHVVLPHYRRMFRVDVSELISDELRVYNRKLPKDRIHLAEDRAFYYQDAVYSNYGADHPRLALAFQREVINNIIPTVQPDLIHCNDWMTGLIPAMARREGIPCLFTIHNIHTWDLTLERIEDQGIDAAMFWRNLYYSRVPISYEESRDNNHVDLLASGIFAAHYVNTVSPTFLKEIAGGDHPHIPWPVRKELSHKLDAECAVGILNSPDPSFDPTTDTMLSANYDADDHEAGKAENKRVLQERLGLIQDPSAPLFYWPSRLDPAQKGCQLLAHILYDLVSSYWQQNLQVAIVANGSFQEAFHSIVRHHGFHDRVAVCDFDEELSRKCYSGADFILMPSLFEPCGLPQMIGNLYGTLPIVHDTGGLHDTVAHLDPERDETKGNGFVFETYDSSGLRWAMDRAMDFHSLPLERKATIVRRIMRESKERFNYSVTAKQYFRIYEQMLKRPLIRSF